MWRKLLRNPPSRFRVSIVAIFLALVIAELFIRFISRHSIDGEIWVGEALLRPYRLPVVSISRALELYRGPNAPRISYDRELGWAPTPNRSFANGRYQYNSAGIRDSREFAPLAPQGKIRIALFGDSFMHGDDVDQADTLSASLEKLLNDSGIQAEVLNFGVSAYGIDQAYLRWEKLGKHFHPHIVIAGFQPENVKRNFNLLRFFYTHREDEIPFTKPRFELRNGELGLLNSPTVPVENLEHFVAGFESSPLRHAEYFYKPEDFRDSWIYKSQLLALATSFFTSSNRYVYEAAERYFYDVSGPPGQLALALLERFKLDVEQSKARFLVLYIPRLRHLLWNSSRAELPYHALLSRLKSGYTVIDPRNELLKASAEDSGDLYVDGVHFSAQGNHTLAEVLTRVLRAPETLETGA